MYTELPLAVINYNKRNLCCLVRVYYSVNLLVKKSAKAQNKPRHALVLLAALMFFCVSSQNSLADDSEPLLKPHSIEYKVHLNSSSIGSTTLGKVKAVVSKSNDGFSVHATAKSQGLGAIFLGNMQERCYFTMEKDRAISHDCTASVGKQDYQVSYLWPKRKLSFDKDEALDMPQGYVMNITIMPFAIAALKGQILSDEVMYVVDAKNKRLRGYKHRLTESETIKTKIGNIEAVKITLEREFRPEKTITMWLSPEHDYLPIKMEERRKSRVTTLSITNIDLPS